MEGFIDWCKSLTMEEMFIVTYLGVLMLGACLGFRFEWIFRKENEEDQDGK
jgi:hypothetical protein